MDIRLNRLACATGASATSGLVPQADFLPAGRERDRNKPDNPEYAAACCFRMTVQNSREAHYGAYATTAAG